MSDLTDRLTAAAAAAIADVAPTIEVDIRKVRSVLFELELASTGQVVDAVCWVERRPG